MSTIHRKLISIIAEARCCTNYIELFAVYIYISKPEIKYIYRYLRIYMNVYISNEYIYTYIYTVKTVSRQELFFKHGWSTKRICLLREFIVVYSIKVQLRYFTVYLNYNRDIRMIYKIELLHLFASHLTI